MIDIKNLIQEEIYKTIDILLDKKISNLENNVTKMGHIASVIDSKRNLYLIKESNDCLYEAFCLSGDIYYKGDEVYILFLNNNSNQNKIIISKVMREHTVPNSSSNGGVGGAVPPEIAAAEVREIWNEI